MVHNLSNDGLKNSHLNWLIQGIHGTLKYDISFINFIYHWKGLNYWFISCLLGWIRDKYHVPTSIVRDGEMSWIETSNGRDCYLEIESLSAAQKSTWTVEQQRDSRVDSQFLSASLKER